jgi:adenylosuccinate synthase
MVIEHFDRQNEASLQLDERLSSTLCGVGSAVSRRALRVADVRLAHDVAVEHPWLARLLTNVSQEANEAVDEEKNVLIEGTQGYGLSLYHADEYPKTTSRDTSASGFLSEVGLSPMLVSEIVLVLRTFPIRVAGPQAGSLHEEISWDILQAESGYPYPIHEVTSVTRRTRRVGRFDWKLAAAAVRANRPTRLAINGLDYLAYQNRGITNAHQLTESAYAFLERLEKELNVPVSYWCTGPEIQSCSMRAFQRTASCALS